MTPLLRYSLLQVPGYLVLVVLLYMAWYQEWLDAGTAAVVMGFWVFKDAVLYPLYRPALQGPAPTGAQALVGTEATAYTVIDPRGLVLVRGERWQAQSAEGTRIPPRTRVRVVAGRGLLLQVTPVDPQID
ncbi:MAG: NfeD family protein [Aquisalimonadaceae bacterium]